ncbi:thioesterase family protein [Lentibacillus sp. N15]|uniref:acyl-CoA thioesterase n=1 Tax=Lentibacillus songyuanensis TaxID=3136161 RepID=UPI0031BA222C
MQATYDIEVYVRFCETDAAGHVNNVSYFLYLEEARTKFFQALGMHSNDGSSSLNFILASTTCDYVAQAYAGQQLKVSSSIDKIGTKSFRIHHVITNADTQQVIAKGSATTVCFNYVEQKTVVIPDVLRKSLESYTVDHVIG